MAYNISVKDDRIILKLNGNVDLSETNDIKVAIAEEPKAGFKFLVINGEALDYIDSSGVALMLFTKKLATEQSLIFEIETLSDNAQKVINLAGLSSILKVKHAPQIKNVPPAESAPKAKEAITDVKTEGDALDFSLDNLFDDDLPESEGKSETDPIKITPGSF